MAVTVSENVLIFTGTTTLDRTTFGPRLYAKALKWTVTGGAATVGTSRARIDAASGGTTLWESVATAVNVDAYYSADQVGGLEFRASASTGTGGITVVVDVGTLYVYG